jgi:hypothetical protein
MSRTGSYSSCLIMLCRGHWRWENGLGFWHMHLRSTGEHASQLSMLILLFLWKWTGHRNTHTTHFLSLSLSLSLCFCLSLSHTHSHSFSYHPRWRRTIQSNYTQRKILDFVGSPGVQIKSWLWHVLSARPWVANMLPFSKLQKWVI